MVATMISICSAVVTYINSAAVQAGYSESFVAQRVFSPSFERENLSSLTVSVFPVSDEIEQLTRTGMLHSEKIAVAIRKPVDPDSTSDGDAMLALVDEIKDSLKFVSMAAAGFRSMENDPIYSPEILESRREFLSVLFVTYSKGR